jgi:hypothetical protein
LLPVRNRSNRSVLLLVFPLLACAHPKQTSNPDLLKPAIETFHQRIRWADWRGASELLVGERRDPFLAARKAENDGKDLQIADYTLEDFQLINGGLGASVVSRLSWVVMPSPSVKERTVRSEWFWLDGTWLLGRVIDGPFPELAETYAPPPPADAGTP